MFIKGVPAEVRVENILSVPLLMVRKNARTNSHNSSHPLSLSSHPSLELMCLLSFAHCTSQITFDLMDKHGHQSISICNKGLVALLERNPWITIHTGSILLFSWL